MYTKYRHIFTPKFDHSYKKLNNTLKEEIVKAVEKFKDNDNHKALKLHKLSGKFKDLYAFSVNFSTRIIIEFDDDKAVFLDVGDHNIYK